jgi:uncharacterized protein
MLLIDIRQIPPEGLDLDEALEPAGLHLQDDADVALRPDGRVTAHVELVDGTTVHIRGRLTGAIEIACARCLQPYALTLDRDLDLFYLPRAAGQEEAQEEEVELSDRDVVVGYYESERVDLGELLREEIVLGLPLKPLCREGCQGLCPRCGGNRNAASCACPPEEEPGDPRLEPLRKLVDDNRQ